MSNRWEPPGASLAIRSSPVRRVPDALYLRASCSSATVKGNIESRRRKFLVSNAVGNDFDSEALSVADRLITRLPVRHHARKFQRIGDPAAVFLPLQVNRQLHPLIILLCYRVSFGQQPHWSCARTVIARILGAALPVSTAASAFIRTEPGEISHNRTSGPRHVMLSFVRVTRDSPEAHSDTFPNRTSAEVCGSFSCRDSLKA